MEITAAGNPLLLPMGANLVKAQRVKVRVFRKAKLERVNRRMNTVNHQLAQIEMEGRL